MVQLGLVLIEKFEASSLGLGAHYHPSNSKTLNRGAPRMSPVSEVLTPIQMAPTDGSNAQKKEKKPIYNPNNLYKTLKNGKVGGHH